MSTQIWQQAQGQRSAWIARHIPHQPPMMLLDTVEKASPDSLYAIALPLGERHPLRMPGRHLGSSLGLEIAAQAMALHGALLALARQESGDTFGKYASPRAGFLVSLRDMVLHEARLDALGLQPRVQVECIAESESLSAYRFFLYGPSLHRLVEGKAWVMLDADRS